MRTIIILLITVTTSFSSAHEEDLRTEEVRVLNQVEKGKNKAYIVARKAGDVVGQPYQVELRVQCGDKEVEPLKLPIEDSRSVCDISPESVVLNRKKNAFAMKVKYMDMEDYNQRVADGEQNIVPRCHKKTKVLKFKVSKICS